MNVGEAMINNDIIKEQNMYIWTKNTRLKVPTFASQKFDQIQIQIWAFTHLEDVFYFQDVSKVNENQLAFTIGIQTLM